MRSGHGGAVGELVGPASPLLPQPDVLQAGHFDSDRRVVGSRHRAGPDVLDLHAHGLRRSGDPGHGRAALQPRRERHAAGQRHPARPHRQTISLDYDDYADAPIWHAQLKDADTNLPPGMGLAPGGGVGLQGVLATSSFGVSPTRRAGCTTSSTTSPAECPEGSHVGDIEVETPVLPAPDRRQGVLRPDRCTRPPDRRQPVEALPAPGGPGRADQARRGRDPVAERSGAHRLPEQPGDAVHPFQAQDGHEGARRADEPDRMRSAGRKRSADGLQRRAEDEHVLDHAGRRATRTRRSSPTSTWPRPTRSRPARIPFRTS